MFTLADTALPAVITCISGIQSTLVQFGSYSLIYIFSSVTQSQESDSSEASVRGPRIKHVCRRAAVALGRNRAVFPDDMPTLSALPWEEREKILSSMGNDGKSTISPQA